MMLLDAGQTLFYYNELAKFWIPFATALWAVFKAATWVKEKLETTNTGITELNKTISESFSKQTESTTKSFEKQTQAVVDGLKELKEEIRYHNMPKSAARASRK